MGAAPGSNGGVGPGALPPASGGATPASGGTPDAIDLACDPAAPDGLSPLRRLGLADYLNSLRDLLAAKGLDGELAAISDELAQLPPDGENQALFADMDPRVTQRHADAYYGVADALSQRLTSDPARLAALAGDCATAATVQASCVDAFVHAFGARALRHPLTSDEAARYTSLAEAGNSGAEAVRRVVFSLLLSPDFLYQLELGTAAVRTGEYDLGAHELAQRLSFHFLRSQPDAELLAAADSGELATDSGFTAAVDRLLADPRTRQTLFRFFEEWYQLRGFAGFASTRSFRAFAGGLAPDLELFGDMLDEFETLIAHTTFDTDGSYADLLTNNLAFVRSPRLAELYGISAWSGSGTPAAFPAGQRSGLLTRAAALVEGNELTNPVKRGAFVLKHVLCQDLSPPSNLPAEALALPPADPNLSTRERFALKTAPGECAGCHGAINPLGFALEAYDALGRFRTTETLYTDDGEVAATVPVNSAVELSLDGVPVMATDPAAFSQALAASPRTVACFARQYFRFSRRRFETASDACAVEAIARAASGAGSLREAFRSIALHPSFRKRLREVP